MGYDDRDPDFRLWGTKDAMRGGVFISVGCSFGSWECVDVPGRVDPSKGCSCHSWLLRVSVVKEC